MVKLATYALLAASATANSHDVDLNADKVATVKPSSGYFTSDTPYWKQNRHFHQYTHIGVIAEYHAAAVNQVDHSGTRESLGLSPDSRDFEEQLDDRGRLIPVKRVNYHVQPTLDCCQTTCQNTAGALRDQEDCQMGCEIWMRHSSLNWEDKSWWPQLEEKCKLDCGQGSLWKTIEGRQGITSDVFKSKEYWMLKPSPNDESICKLGCGHYNTCMNSLISVTPAPGPPPSRPEPTALTAAHHKGWSGNDFGEQSHTIRPTQTVHEPL